MSPVTKSICEAALSVCRDSVGAARISGEALGSLSLVLATSELTKSYLQRSEHSSIER